MTIFCIKIIAKSRNHRNLSRNISNSKTGKTKRGAKLDLSKTVPVNTTSWINLKTEPNVSKKWKSRRLSQIIRSCSMSGLKLKRDGRVYKKSKLSANVTKSTNNAPLHSLINILAEKPKTNELKKPNSEWKLQLSAKGKYTRKVSYSLATKDFVFISTLKTTIL